MYYLANTDCTPHLARYVRLKSPGVYRSPHRPCTAHNKHVLLTLTACTAQCNLTRYTYIAHFPRDYCLPHQTCTAHLTRMVLLTSPDWYCSPHKARTAHPIRRLLLISSGMYCLFQPNRLCPLHQTFLARLIGCTAHLTGNILLSSPGMYSTAHLTSHLLLTSTGTYCSPHVACNARLIRLVLHYFPVMICSQY
jgi:hypothetical protein